jgi:hypothetical protein
VAVRLDPLAEAGVVEVTVAGNRLTVWHLPGTASALEQADTATGRDVGATGVFRSVLHGRQFTFTRHGEAFVDDQTGSRWDIFGRAVAGPLAGEQLEAVEHIDTFWFAWAAYEPSTRIEP